MHMALTVGSNFIKKNLPLLSKKGRDEKGLFIVEGEKFVSEIPLRWPLRFYLMSETFAMKSILPAYENRAPVYTAPDHLYKKLSDTVTPQGIMAVCEKKQISPENLIKDDGLLLLCENLADPGNVGTLIRTARAANAAGVILTKGSAELYSPKVIRACAGSLFHIPCAEDADALSAVRYLKAGGFLLAAAHLNGGVSYYDADMTKACCILIGNEARGLSDELSSFAQLLVKIPMSGGIDSLNAAVAGSILLYEAVRQRAVRGH